MTEETRGLLENDSLKRNDAPQEEPQYKTYGYRWVVLVAYMLSTIANAIMWVTFSPVSDKVEEYLKVNSTWVNNLGVVFLIVYIPVGFPSSYVLDRYGLRLGVCIGTAATAIGGIVRITATFGAGYYGAIAGQILAAIGQPLIMSAPPKLAAQWFPIPQRTIATTLASVANPIGVAIGFLLPPALVSNYHDVSRLLYAQAGIIAALCIPALLLIRERPPTPPSFSAGEEKVENIFASLRTILTNKDMWILFIEFGFGLGAYNTLATTLNEMIKPYHYTNQDAGTLGAVVVVCGLVGSAIVGPVVDKTKKYKYILCGCLICATGAMLGLTFSLKPHNLPLLIVLAGTLGLTMTPLIPVTMELGAELTYPLGEATPTNFLIMAGQITGIAFIFIMDYFLSHHSYRNANFMVVGCLAFSAIAMLFLKEDLKRLREDRAGKADLNVNSTSEQNA